MEYFVEKVKLHPCLWNTNDMSYRDIGKKDLAWERIANECGIISGKEAKTQWKKLRDSHREALRRRKICARQAAQHIKPWRYETIMKFLLPQHQNRTTTSNFLQCIPSTSQETFNVNANIDTTQSSFSPVKSSSATEQFSEIDRKKKKLNSENLNEILEQRDRRRDQRQDELRKRRTKSHNTSQDALSNLFTSFCQKTRELPKYLQLRVQKEVFESISHAEEEALRFEPVTVYCTATPSSTTYEFPNTAKIANNPLSDVSSDPETSRSSSPIFNIENTH